MKTLMSLALLVVVIEASPNAAIRLTRRLMRDSDAAKLVRPITNQSHAILVDFNITLTTITRNTNTLSVDALARLSWVSSTLRWNPANFAGITNLHLSLEKIWTPDILQYPGKQVIDWGYVHALGHVNGLVHAVIPVSFDMECSTGGMDDDAGEQYECASKFGPWTYDGTQVDLREPEFDLSIFTFLNLGRPAIYHDLVGTATRNAVHYPCCPHPYINVEFKLTFHT